MTDRNGTQVFWFDFNGDGNLIRVYDADAREVRYDYNNGSLIRVTDVLDQETTYEYSNGNLVKKTNALGHELQITYNASNEPVKVTNPEGGTYTFEYDYDKNKRLYYAMVKTPGGTVREIWYSADGDTIRVDLNGVTIQKVSVDKPDPDGHRPGRQRACKKSMTKTTTLNP